MICNHCNRSDMVRAERIHLVNEDGGNSITADVITCKRCGNTSESKRWGFREEGNMKGTCVNCKREDKAIMAKGLCFYCYDKARGAKEGEREKALSDARYAVTHGLVKHNGLRGPYKKHHPEVAEQSAQEKIRLPEAERIPEAEDPIKLPPFVPGAVSNSPERKEIFGYGNEDIKEYEASNSWADTIRETSQRNIILYINLKPEDKAIVERYKNLQKRIAEQVMAQLGE